MNQNASATQKKRLWRGIILLYLILGGIGAYFVIGYTALYKQERFVYADEHDFKKRLMDMDEWLGESAGPTNSAEILARAKAHYRQATLWAGGLLTLSILLFIGVWQWGRFAPFPQLKPLALVSMALICLAVGLFTPMMEIGAYERDLEIPLKIKTGMFSLNIDYTQTFAGDLYLYYQSKSIMELIALLFKQNNFVVGLSILLFSVLIPFSKLALSGGVLWRPALLDKSWARFILEKTGKWSMADVFVVALFLGYLAFNNMQAGVQADSRVLLGLYFFLAYCLLAIVLPSFLQKIIALEQ